MRAVWMALVPALVGGCVFKETTESETVEFTEEFERITIDSDGGSIAIRGDASSGASGEVTYIYDRARPTMVWALQDDGELLVTVDCAYTDAVCEVDMDLSIPAEIVTLVDTRVGDIEAEGIVLTTTLDARSGSVTATDIGGDLNVDVGTGDVDATGLTGRRVTVAAEDGALNIAHDLGFDLVQADTGKGDVNISVIDGRYNVVASAGNGGGVTVTGLTADTSVETRIEASTADGNVVITGSAP